MNFQGSEKKSLLEEANAFNKIAQKLQDITFKKKILEEEKDTVRTKEETKRKTMFATEGVEGIWETGNFQISDEEETRRSKQVYIKRKTEEADRILSPKTRARKKCKKVRR